ncbi:MAG: glycosyltransferase [Pirellulaceae bacterium]
MAERKIRVAFFTPECRPSRNHVFLSQVLGQANALQVAGFECLVIASEPDESAVQETMALPEVCALSRACIFNIYPRRPSSLSFYRIAKTAAKLVEPTLQIWRPDTIYVRGVTSFRAAATLARRVGAKVAYDARGLVAEESILAHGMQHILAYYHRFRESEACKEADTLLCVSERFRTYLEGLTGRKDILVVPCCVNENKFGHKRDARREIRQNLGWSEHAPVVTYCGGLSKWQRTEDVLRLMLQMKSLKPDLKCLLLVSDPEKMDLLAAKIGLVGRDFKCLRAAHDVIPDWLSVADAGIILRHDILVNNVASPVKIAEYLACGLPVICSRGIGDLSGMIGEANVGVVLQGMDWQDARFALDLVQRTIADPDSRARMRALVQAKLCWDAYLERYRLAYRH